MGWHNVHAFLVNILSVWSIQLDCISYINKQQYPNIVFFDKTNVQFIDN